MADMNLNTLLTQTMGGSQSASQELHQALKKAISKHDQGLTADQQSKAFIERLKTYSDNLENSSAIINQYLQDFGGDVINKNSPNNPKPPPADSNLTQDGPPPDSTGTANPFFSPSPMATFFQAFLSMIQMQGYIAEIQGETAIENMQSTLAIGKDQANSIQQQAKAEANSLTQQATLDYVMGGLQLASAVGTLSAGLGEIGSNSKEVGEAEDAVNETSEELKTVKNFNKNNTALGQVDRDSTEIDKESTNVQKEIDLKAKKDALPPGQELETEDNLMLTNLEKRNVESKEKLETMQKKAQLDQKNLKEDIKSAEQEEKALNDEYATKKARMMQLDEKSKDGTITNKEITESKELETEMKDLEPKQRAARGKVAVLKAKHESAVSDELYADYKLAKDPSSGKTDAEIAQANNAFQNHHQKIIRDTQLVDSADINPGDKAAILGETDKVYKNFTKVTENNNLKLSKLTARKDIATQREQLLNKEQSQLKTAFKDSVADKDNGAELLSKLEEKPESLERELDQKLTGQQRELEALKKPGSIGRGVAENWQLQVFNQFVQSADKFIDASKKNIDAQGKLNAAFWQSRSTLDGTYLQMMQQAMQNMFEANKGSIETGGQYAQALMGISDKEVNTVHWAV